MTAYEFSDTYDQELDPTPEDGRYTPEDLLVIMFDQLKNMDPKDLTIWQASDLADFEKLFREGQRDGEGNLFPVTPEPEALEDWDDDGYSRTLSSDCVQYSNIYQAAESYAASGNRILMWTATIMRRQWYMLPIPRLADDEAFQQRYLMNATCSPHVPVTFRGRSGFINKSVFAHIISQPFTDRAGQERVKFLGSDPIEDHHQPITGTNMTDLVENILPLFEARFAPNGPGIYGFIRTGAHEVFDMDRKPHLRWEEWRPPTRSFKWDRAGEIEEAWEVAKAL